MILISIFSLWLYESIAKRIKQQTSIRWFGGSKPGRGFKSPINWNPFQVQLRSKQIAHFYIIPAKANLCLGATHYFI